MAEPIIDWANATVKVSVPVHHTATSDVQEIEIPLTFFEERLLRLEAALAAAVTGLELLIDGETTRSPEELVEMLLYPEHFGLADRMRGTKGHERIEIARTS